MSERRKETLEFDMSPLEISPFDISAHGASPAERAEYAPSTPAEPARNGSRSEGYRPDGDAERASPDTSTQLESLEPVETHTIAGHRVGRVVGWDDHVKAVVIDFPGNPHGAQAARSLIAFDSRSAHEALGRELLLTFEDERSDRPIVVGLFPTTVDARAAGQDEEAAGREPSGFDLDSATARVDGKRIVLRAEDELELRCGDASLVLRRNGRVTLRGAYIETSAEGVNRIKGGAVRIN